MCAKCKEILEADMEIIQSFNTSMSKDDNNKFTKSQTKLLMHVTNKDNYRANQYKVFNNLTISKNYDSQNQRRSYFFDCDFEQASFQNCGLTGSYFIKCRFIDCNLNFAIFDNCYFDNCTFEYNNYQKIQSASFCGSIIKDSFFSKCCLNACSLTNISCYGTTFKICVFDNIIWENSKIYGCIFNNVKLKNLNIEFVLFDSNTLINTHLPFASIPFCFKCLDYLMKTKDSVYINSELKEKGISKEEYLDLIPDFICFYSYTNNYFPLANIYAAIGEINKSFETIKKSIHFLIKLHEYRTLKYMSQLMTLYDFSVKQKNEIYQIITNELYLQSLSQEDKLLNADIYLYEIRNNLLNAPLNGYVTFELYTDISSENSKKLSFFIEKIENLFLLCAIPNTHYLEYRHNSPYQFFLSVFSSPTGIVEIIGIIYLALLGIDKFYNKYLDTKQKELSIKKTEQEILRLRNENQSRTKEEQRNECTNTYEAIKDQSINIGVIYHNVYNTDLTNYGDGFQHYSNK